ncbi:MAG: hypothetical protein C6W55_16480 [Thermobacillus sp.]|nr:MAG: hypothetical protein C6W55_16480 [Thermobacillus sp.]
MDEALLLVDHLHDFEYFMKFFTLIVTKTTLPLRTLETAYQLAVSLPLTISIDHTVDCDINHN